MQTGSFIVAVKLFLYSGGSRFRPESEHWLSWLRFLRVFSSEVRVRSHVSTLHIWWAKWQWNRFLFE